MLSESQSAPDIAKHHAWSRVPLRLLHSRGPRTRHVTFASSSWRTACRHTNVTPGVNEKVNTPKRERERESVRVCSGSPTNALQQSADTWRAIQGRGRTGLRDRTTFANRLENRRKSRHTRRWESKCRNEGINGERLVVNRSSEWSKTNVVARFVEKSCKFRLCS